MGRPSLNKTAKITLTMTPQTRERLTAYSLERQLSISQLVSEWIWSIPLQSDRKNTDVGEKADKTEQ